MLLSSEQRKLLVQSTELYNQSLHKAEGYLASRGLSLEFADGECLGYVEDPLPGQEQFRGRLSIPYLTRAGVVNLKFRSIEPDWESQGDSSARDAERPRSGPKYLNLAGFETNLYMVESFFAQSDFICVAEGEIDALSLRSAGLPAIGLPGVKSWKPFYRRCFEDYPVIWVFCDGDEPGRDLGNFLSREIKARPIHMPDGEDVNSMLVKHGPEWLRERIEK
jgi:DNA primase